VLDDTGDLALAVLPDFRIPPTFSVIQDSCRLRRRQHRDHLFLVVNFNFFGFRSATCTSIPENPSPVHNERVRARPAGSGPRRDPRLDYQALDAR